MTSLAELEKKLASITGDDTMYDNNNDVETNNNNGQDEVKKNNISSNNNITDKINNMSINSIDNIKNGSQRNGFANGNGSVSSYLSPSSSSSKINASNKPGKIYDQEYTEKMYKRGMETKEKLKKRRQSIPEGCTFNPTISRRSKRLGSISGKATRRSGNAFERLYKNAEITKHSIEKLREEELMEQCTFQPKINTSSSAIKKKSNKNKNSVNNNSNSGGRVSRFDRLYEDAAQSRAKLAKKKIDHDSKVLTFKPKITSRGSRSRSPGGRKRYEMLYNDGKKERIQRRKQEKDEKEIVGCTFQPKINRRRSSSARRSRGSDKAPKDVYARLQEYGKRTNAKLKKKREAKDKAELEALGLVVATDNNTSLGDGNSPNKKLSPKNAHKMTKEEIDKSVNRLSNEYIKKRDAKLKKREKELKKEEGLTFRPSIKPYRRPQSARRARPNEKPQSKIWERLHRQSQDTAKRQERIKQAKVEREMEECTFKPKVGKRSANIIAKARRRGRSPSPSPNGISRTTSNNGRARKSNVYSPESKTPGKGNRNLSVYYLEEPNSKNYNYNNNSKTNDGVESVNSTTHNNSMNNSTMSNGRQKQKTIPIWERLSYDKRDIVNERAQLKLQKEIDECKPKKRSPPKRDGVAKRKPIWERLNEQRKDVEALDAMKEFTEMQKCTFKPKTRWGKGTRTSGRKPIWERLNERKNKTELMEERVQSKINEENEKFVKKAKGKIVSRNKAKSIFDRLHKQKLGVVRGWQDPSMSK